MKRIFLLACAIFFIMGTQAQNTYYVSKNTGSNRNDGSKAKPYKNLQKAINVAAKGDKILVAEGNYYGLLNKGSLEVKHAIEIYGGYSADFSSCQPLHHISKIAPPASSNATAANAGMFYINVNDNEPGTLIVDGLVFDKGNSNAYHASKGKPEGVATGMYLKPPLRGANNVISTQSKLLGGSFSNGEVIIRNCVFNNGDKHAIQMGVKKANVLIENNVFTSNMYAAVEVWGKLPDRKAASIEFAYNTVLFSWARTKDMRDMGYGFRCMTGLNINVHNNIFGLSNLAGIDRTRGEEGQTLKVDNNMFFMNKQADLCLPGAGKFLRIYVDMFEDVEQLTTASHNAELSAEAAAALQKVLNRPYLTGFLAASYKESSDYDPNSSVNQMRSMLGMNTVGTIHSSVSMFANKYPLADAIKLFGVVKGYGAQPVAKR